MTPDPNDFQYWFTRLETKIDKLDEKLDGAVNTLGRHEERINSLEKAQTSRSTVWAAIGVGLLAWVPSIVDIFTK